MYALIMKIIKLPRTPKIVLIGFLIITLLFSLYVFINVKDNKPLTKEEEEVVKASKGFYEIDRCDPFKCVEYFQVRQIEKLTMDKPLFNTGAAKMQVGRCYQKGCGVYILESSDINGTVKREKTTICKSGDYLVSLTKHNIFLFPTEDILMCYSYK